MTSFASQPWYNAPARPFPVKVWLKQRFSFHVSIPSPTPADWKPAVHVPTPADETSAVQVARRQFPAQVWLAEHQAGAAAALAPRHTARSGRPMAGRTSRSSRGA